MVVEALTHGDLDVVGQITESSNIALLCEVTGPAVTEAAEATGAPVHVIYKPVRGERPLWDFPDGTLAGREVATFAVSRAAGWDVVPPTVLRDGALGQGSVRCGSATVLAVGQRPAGRHLRAAQGAGRVALGGSTGR